MTLTKEWLQQTIAELEEERDAVPGAVNEDATMALTAMKLALASLEAEKIAEPVAKVETVGVCWYADNGVPRKPAVGTELYAAPPAPVAVPDELTREEYKRRFMEEENFDDTYRGGWNACRAAMLQCADTELQRKAAIHDVLCAKYNVESLADFVDWQRNHITELEAAPPAPVGEGETAVMPDYPGYVMTQRECYQVGVKVGMERSAPVLQVWYGAMPETNGKTNWTAILHRKGDHLWEGITIDRSEYPDRVRYEADRMRHLIGELADEPDILAYDAEAHSGYVYPGNSPVIPDGWALVPVEPTAEMISSGIAAHYERSQIQIHDRPAPGPMECAYVAMLAAAPQQEVK
ncbi:hypothetical protein ACE3I4_13915 [Enterobacter hormaechei subsp. xiangfangensis]